MRYTIAAALLGICAAGAAQAQVVAYDFTAVIEEVAEGLDGVANPAKVASSTLSGNLVASGDTISGRFYFDLSTPFNGWEPLHHENTGGAANYLAGFGTPTNAGSSIQFDRSGYRYASIPQWYTGIQVLDKPAGSGRDLFLVAGNNWTGASALEMGTVNFWDARGTALSGADIPAGLDLSDWTDPMYTYYWRSGAGQPALWVHARITDLSPASPVPEPATFAMMALGIALIGTRYRSANFAVDRLGVRRPAAASRTGA